MQPARHAPFAVAFNWGATKFRLAVTLGRDCHELYDVLQLAVGELPNKLRQPLGAIAVVSRQYYPFASLAKSPENR